jgi:hypothetical protein
MLTEQVVVTKCKKEKVEGSGSVVEVTQNVQAVE